MTETFYCGRGMGVQSPGSELVKVFPNEWR